MHPPFMAVSVENRLVVPTGYHQFWLKKPAQYADIVFCAFSGALSRKLCLMSKKMKSLARGRTPGGPGARQTPL